MQRFVPISFAVGEHLCLKMKLCTRPSKISKPEVQKQRRDSDYLCNCS
jgi:hypothetical protein